MASFLRKKSVDLILIPDRLVSCNSGRRSRGEGWIFGRPLPFSFFQHDPQLDVRYALVKLIACHFYLRLIHAVVPIYAPTMPAPLM